MDIDSWTQDRLHDVLGLSDKYTAQFLIGMSRKASSSDDLLTNLESTGAVTMTNEMRAFAVELWNKVPHRKTSTSHENPNRMREAQILAERRKNLNYKILSDDDDDVELGRGRGRDDVFVERRDEGRGRRKNIRQRKTTWDSGSEAEDDDVAGEKRKGRKKKTTTAKGSGSDSDDWDETEKNRKKDLEERDAFAERMKMKDKEKTRHIVERSDRKVYN